MQPSRIVALGNIKYDGPSVQTTVAEVVGSRVHQLRELSRERGILLDPERLTLLGGSTHPGEEKWLGQIFQRLRMDIPDLSLVIVPRHVERAKQAVADLEELGLVVLKRSEMKSGQKGGVIPDVLLVDTTGELNDWYRLSTIVFVGKSLGIEATGGQNPIEPLAAGKPALFGPHMENFREIVPSLLADGAAIQVESLDCMYEESLRLLRDSKERSEQVARATDFLMQHHGSADRAVQAIRAEMR
jgi:3-deoxy-D-manno-octulosonic-acid transferase